MSENKLSSMRHTLAHLLAQAVMEKYPHAKPTIGPAVGDGFYYDFDFAGGDTPGDADLANLQKSMRKNLKKWTEWEHEAITVDEAREKFKDNDYKTELINEIEQNNEEITLYTSGGFTDLCRGGHTENPAKDIDPKAFKLNNIAGAYWRGDEKNPMLTRIYGLAFETEEALKAHLGMLEEAKKRDHRKLGKELDLFTFSELIGSGLPLFTPRGTLMRDLIVDKIQATQKEFGYERVTIPHITKKDLYETSGHWEKFGDELFKVSGASDTQFVMKPMNCPHHTQIYASKARSYRDLPIRFTEATMVYRDEQAGELLGLSRVRSITQDDGHAFCTLDQVEHEIDIIVKVIEDFYTSLGMYNEDTFWVSLSVRDSEAPEQYLGDTAKWDQAEKALETIAKKKNLPYKRVEGEAAFYGPKLDFMFKDAIGREWQLATAQLDFVMPERFSLSYTDKDGSSQTPVMIHRAIAGSLERFMSVIIEHFAGNFPLWLSPEQVRIIPIADAHNEYAQKVYDALKNAGIRVHTAHADDSLGKRIRAAKVEKVPYSLVLGDTETDATTVMVEGRDDGNIGSLSIEEFIERIKKEEAH